MPTDNTELRYSLSFGGTIIQLPHKDDGSTLTDGEVTSIAEAIRAAYGADPLVVKNEVDTTNYQLDWTASPAAFS